MHMKTVSVAVSPSEKVLLDEAMLDDVVGAPVSEVTERRRRGVANIASFDHGTSALFHSMDSLSGYLFSRTRSFKVDLVPDTR